MADERAPEQNDSQAELVRNESESAPAEAAAPHGTPEQVAEDLEQDERFQATDN